MHDIFKAFRLLRQFEKRHLSFLETLEDFDLVTEIGCAAATSEPLTLKQVSLLGISSSATCYRRLQRLKELGVVRQRRAHADARSIELSLSPKILTVYRRYYELIGRTLLEDKKRRAVKSD
jgi:hypothetical protein